MARFCPHPSPYTSRAGQVPPLPRGARARAGNAAFPPNDAKIDRFPWFPWSRWQTRIRRWKQNLLGGANTVLTAHNATLELRLPSQIRLVFTAPILTEGWPGWVDLWVSWRTEMVAHPSPNRTRRRITPLIDSTVLPLFQTDPLARLTGASGGLRGSLSDE